MIWFREPGGLRSTVFELLIRSRAFQVRDRLPANWLEVEPVRRPIIVLLNEEGLVQSFAPSFKSHEEADESHFWLELIAEAGYVAPDSLGPMIKRPMR